MGQPVNVGVVGCGAISAQYFQTIERLPQLRLVAVADLDLDRAREAVRTYAGVDVTTVVELVADPRIDIVLNLTIPAAHAEIALQAIAAGKEVYCEKPLAVTAADAGRILEAAGAAGLRVGCAPDTVLGTGTQTARKAIDDGLIGRPVAATATMVTPGHERWHPNPDFYYLPGGGPLLDMGPYYVTSLVTLLGPVSTVIGAASRTRAKRTIGSGPRRGEEIPVTVDTHVTGVLVHASGALSTLVMSFDAAATKAPNIEVHGERGSLVVPDPNRFDGPVMVSGVGEEGWRTLPVAAGYLDAGRGVGLADFAATPPGEEPRAGGSLAYHVLDIMESLLASAHSGAAVTIESTCERPRPVALLPPRARHNPDPGTPAPQRRRGPGPAASTAPGPRSRRR
ncbi:Gfo/Idh/MocA family oxidoreductase [Nonomuraea sp. K274]|uniref:Gfo/Idh/MocA family oxidoreductase n=1 Tax=Nonomuraea cypriaca TaxID=1187855 RepID=A0A931A6I0_9ACTN|nr:Gfo/Idh/MocA family oxidoreductase [Nonomuraea cypriaca]MBF8187156.1 Gfo/Idh/MocA family oxidoreductase [Nonomuraea cypriaca]